MECNDYEDRMAIGWYGLDGISKFKADRTGGRVAVKGTAREQADHPMQVFLVSNQTEMDGLCFDLESLLAGGARMN